MKRALVWMAAGVLLAANASVLVSVSAQRSSDLGGTIELTERELRLPERVGESTALFLTLDWDAISNPPGRRRAPVWLDAGKLAELGFDCDVPVTSSDARRHYRSQRTAMVYLVFEFEGESWKGAPPDRKRETRLFAVDAGRDPQAMRELYPDRARYLLIRGLVGIHLREHSAVDHTPLPEPRLHGWIVAVLPAQIFVSRPHNDVLEDLRALDGPSERPKVSSVPRFSATVSWGTRGEPRVERVRRRED